MEKEFLTKTEIIEKLQTLPREKLVELINKMRNDELIYVDNYEMEIPEHIKKRIEDGAEYSYDWKKVVEDLPRKLKKVPYKDKNIISHAIEIWDNNYEGNIEIRDLLIDVALQYSSSYKSAPILLLGPPGCGKTHATKLFAQMLGLNFYQYNAIKSASRGLTGECTSYQSPYVGEVVQGMIESKSINYVLSVDEIDKAINVQAKSNLQDEILSLTDDNNVNWKDSYLQFNVNASFIPVIMTANDEKKISNPLLNRCFVINFPKLTKDDFMKIIKKHTIPKFITENQLEDKIIVSDELIEFSVDTVLREGSSSVRDYNNLIEQTLRRAKRRFIESDEIVKISEYDVLMSKKYLSISNY